MTLTRSAPLKRKKPLKRTPLKRVSSKKRKTSWRSVKRDPLDILWSKVVRARDKHTCQGKIGWQLNLPDDSPDFDEPCDREAPYWQMDGAHIFKRKKTATRWDLRNGVTLCKMCHDWTHRNERAFEKWARVRLFDDYAALEALSTPISRVDRDEVRARLRAMLKEYES